MAATVLVEAEPAIADAVVSRLRSEGLYARAEVDGLKALEVCRQLEPDLAVGLSVGLERPKLAPAGAGPGGVD